MSYYTQLSVTTEGEKRATWYSAVLRCGTAPVKGSFSNDDGDGNDNGKKTIGLISKPTTFHVLPHFFLYISLPSWLDDYEVKMPNFTFYGERKQGTTIFSFPF